MAGGKGKSSGGKSSGGKVGADGSKKQTSHSQKAGLQVSTGFHVLRACQGQQVSGSVRAVDGEQLPHQVASCSDRGSATRRQDFEALRAGCSLWHLLDISMLARDGLYGQSSRIGDTQSQ